MDMIIVSIEIEGTKLVVAYIGQAHSPNTFIESRDPSGTTIDRSEETFPTIQEAFGGALAAILALRD